MLPCLLAKYGVGNLGLKWSCSSIKRRYGTKFATKNKRGPLYDYDRHAIYLVAIPITTKHSYIFSRYSEKALPGGKPSIEAKIVDKSANLWKKMEKSQNWMNKWLVKILNKWLVNIPWIETSLKSLPSQRKINRFTKKDDKPVSHHEIIRSNIKSDQLKSIPLFYPANLLDLDKIVAQIRPDLGLLYKRHTKLLIYDLLLLPLTIPIILIPIIPNIPGFYLSYRAYCHWKVLLGISHLKYLLETGNHLAPKKIQMEDVYQETADIQCKENIRKCSEVGHEPESLVISEDIVPALCESFGVPNLTNNLLTAIRQERKRLKEGTPEFPWKNQSDK